MRRQLVRRTGRQAHLVVELLEQRESPAVLTTAYPGVPYKNAYGTFVPGQYRAIAPYVANNINPMQVNLEPLSATSGPSNNFKNALESNYGNPWLFTYAPASPANLQLIVKTYYANANSDFSFFPAADGSLVYQSSGNVGGLIDVATNFQPAQGETARWIQVITTNSPSDNPTIDTPVSYVDALPPASIDNPFYYDPANLFSEKGFFDFSSRARASDTISWHAETYLAVQTGQNSATIFPDGFTWGWYTTSRAEDPPLSSFSVASDTNPVGAGTAVTITATLGTNLPNKIDPNSWVEFVNDTTKTVLGRAHPLANKGVWQASVNATFLNPFGAVPKQDIRATFDGDSFFAGSTATYVQNVAQKKAQLNLGVPGNVFALGQPITFTTAFALNAGDPSAPTPTGTISFYDGSTLLGSSTIDLNGRANYTTSALSSGSHAITAVYSGDETYSGTTSAAVDPYVDPPSGSVTLNSLIGTETGTVSYDDGAGHSGSVFAYLSQFNVTYAGSTGTPITFDTFCIDLFHDVSVGQTYAVNVRDDLGAAFVNASRMAYVYETFGAGDLSSDPDTAAAVQIALWDLSLNNHNPTSFTQDADGTYSSGDEGVFAVDLSTDPSAAHIAALVNQYLQQSVGATTQAGWLDAAAQGDYANRGQSLILPQPQFGNQPAATGVTFTATEGLPASPVVAVITEADPSVQASDFQATIDWGDGSAPSAGVVAADGFGGFFVQGSHTYAEEGTYSVIVTVQLGTQQVQAAGTAAVEDAPLTLQTLAPTFSAAPGAPLGTGQTPDSVATGDFNGDGNADLLVANFYGNTVSVYFGDGHGGFTPAGVYATGSGANGFAVAPDGSYFAIGNYYDGTVSVFANQGDGTFVLSQTLTTGAGPANRMALTDLNGDGNLDLVTANQNANSVSVFLGNGDGTFQAGTNFAAGNGTIAVVAGDFNGDGTIDLVTANYNDSTVTLLAGNGDGTFAAPVVVGQAPGNPFDLVAADFNGDGKLDVAVASLFGQVTVLQGRGDGTFDAASVNSGSNPTQLTVGDFNGDGVLDLAVSNYGSNTVGILSGNGDGTFQPVVSVPAAGGLNGIIAGDFNNDGGLDLAVVGQDNNTAQVLLNQSIQATAGQPFSGVLASFTDANPNATTADYSATIDWGDGTTSQVGAGAFTTNNRGGFDLTAGHDFAAAGSYTVHVTITDAGGSSVDAFSVVSVQ